MPEIWSPTTSANSLMNITYIDIDNPVLQPVLQYGMEGAGCKYKAVSFTNNVMVAVRPPIRDVIEGDEIITSMSFNNKTKRTAALNTRNHQDSTLRITKRTAANATYDYALFFFENIFSRWCVAIGFNWTKVHGRTDKMSCDVSMSWTGTL